MSAGWLAQLAPDHAPPAAGWWPPAPGWWMVAAAGAAAAALIVMAVRWWHNPQRRLRRATLRELRLIRASGADGPDVARAIESLLRRHAIAVHGRERVARLTGRAWLGFLDESGAGPLAGEAGSSLLAAAFGDRDGGAGLAAHREQWLAAADRLIRRAGRVPAAGGGRS